MNNRKYRLFASIITIICLLFSMSTMAFAAGPGHVDQDATGSLNIRFRDADGNPITGGNVAIFYIASVVKGPDGNDAYQLTDEFASLEIDYDNFASEEFVKQAEDLINTNYIKGTLVDIDANGFAYFGNLPVGMYLITQPKPNTGWFKIKSYVATIPLNENGTWMYDIDSVPKMEPKCDKVAQGLVPTDTPVPTGPSVIIPPPGGNGVSTGDKLPQTGKLNWPIPVMAFAGIALILSGWSIKKYSK